MSLLERFLVVAFLGMANSCLMGAAPALAHELQENRVAMVLHEPRHLSLQFYVDYLAMLRPVVEPSLSADAFARKYAAAPPAVMAGVLSNAQLRWQKGVRLNSAGAPLQLGNWHWPSVGDVQKALQQRVMQRMVAPAEHPEPVLVEITADALSSTDIVQVDVQLPEEMYPMMVVSYRPHQTWIKPGVRSTIGFQ